MRVLLSILTLAISSAFIGCSPNGNNKEGGNYMPVASKDAEMNAAIEKARSTSDDFVRAFHAQKNGTTDFFVKKPYPTPAGGGEHMWIEVMREEKGVLEGLVANEAEETREVKIGQKVSLKISEISDWKYQDGKKLIGGYTIRYFVEKMPPQARAAFLKEAGFEL